MLHDDTHIAKANIAADAAGAMFTSEEVAHHRTADDCWISCKGKV